MPTELRRAIVRLAVVEAPISVARIADRIGCSTWTVYAALQEARRAGAVLPRYRRRPVRRPGRLDLTVPAEAARALHDAAAARGWSDAHLAQRLLAQAAGDGLIDAILDDATPDDGRPATGAREFPTQPKENRNGH